MKVKPAEGRAVRDPLLRDLLPAEGRSVPRDDYWIRRLLDGDVVEVAEESASTEKGKR